VLLRIKRELSRWRIRYQVSTFAHLQIPYILYGKELEHNTEDNDGTAALNSPPSGRPLVLEGAEGQEQKLSRLHDIFRYRSSTISTTGPQERTIASNPRTSLGA
jgi:hypothetical protein